MKLSRSMLTLLLLLVLAWPAIAQTFEQAEALYQHKSFDAARSALLKASVHNGAGPQGITARFHAAKCLFEKKDLAGFEKEGRALLKQYLQASAYDRNDLELYLARIPLEQGKLREAVAQLDDVAMRHSTSVAGGKARKLEGEALRKLKDFDKAREVYLKLAGETKKASWAVQGRHRAACCLFDKGDYAGFVKEADGLLKQNPPADDHDVQMTRFNLAHVPGKLGRYREAAEAIEDFIKKYPKFTQVNLGRHRCGYYYMLAADKLAREGKKDAAEACAAKGKAMLAEARTWLVGRIARELKTAPAIHAQSMFVETYMFEHDYPKMAEAARKMAASAPQKSLAWATGTFWLGVAKAQANPPERDAAAMAFDQVINANVQDPNVEEHLPTNALYWRAMLAQTRKEGATLKLLIKKIGAMPEGPVKKSALARLGSPVR